MAYSLDTPLRAYIIFGMPGAGKGYCAQALKEKKGYDHLSVGDYLRDEVRDYTDVGRKYANRITGGLELIPSHIVESIVEDRILKALANQKNIVIDGFPRTLKQANFLSSLLLSSPIKLRYVYLKVDKNLAVSRLMTRESCLPCGHDYIMTTTKTSGKCDLCGEALFKRPTDTKETILKRIGFFNQTTQTVINYLEAERKLLQIDANKHLEELVTEFLNSHERWQ